MARRHPEDCMCVICTAARKKSRASASTTRRGKTARGRSSSKSRTASTRTASSSRRASTRSAASSRSATRSRTSSGSRASSKKTAARGSRATATRGAAAHPLTGHDEIRRWAEERGAHPACVRRTGGGDDIGMIRLDFPGYSGADSLEQISWDDWFRKFDENGLALLVQDTTSRGQKSNFNKLVSRQTVRRAA